MRLPPSPLSARILTTVLALAVAAPAGAQFGLERVVSNINVANLNAQGSCLLNTSVLRAASGGRCGLYGWGLEVALALSSDTARWQYQFAVGYGQITGFQAVEPTMDMRGMMRLAPEVSFYATRVINSWLMPYAGVHTGLVNLNNVQAYTNPGDTIYTFSATTMQFGGTLGLFFPYNLYLDVGYRYRDFRSLEWRRNVLPARWPKSIVMSALQITAGYQFDVGGLTGKRR